jgi:membrane peptidoglycan carboxypeptidase
VSSSLNIARQRRHHRQKILRSASQRSQRAVLAFGFAFSAVLLILILAGAGAYASLTAGLPSLDQLNILLAPQDGLLLQPTRLYDRTGQHLLAVLSPSNSSREYIPYHQFPITLIDATIAVSQPSFRTSPGWSLAGWQDSSVHPTLAQQLVYQLILWDAPAGMVRSLHERMLAAQMTAEYGRDQVMEWYLNSADYGRHAYGAAAAARLYLGKSVKDLDLGETALLAALSQDPSLDPFDSPASVETRRIAVLQSMMEQGLVTPGQVSRAILNPPSLLSSVDPSMDGVENIAPAFVDFALSQLRSLYPAGRLERGGLAVLTSLDYDLQLQVLCAVRAQVDRLENDVSLPAASEGSSCEAARLLSSPASPQAFSGASASALLLDPQTGQVLAMVGDLQGGFQGSALQSHSAGTSISPFIYLTGFSKGFNPASLAWDIPGATVGTAVTYQGPVRLRIALANDYLAPARSLLSDLSQESVINTAASLGLHLPSGGRLLQDDFSLSPLDLAAAYAVFANAGLQVGQPLAGESLSPTAVLQVQGVDHSNWTDWSQPQNRSVVSAQLAYLLNQVLSDETARWPSLGHPNPLEIGRPAGARLSHSLDRSGAWAIGYTPQRLAVVWLGAAGPLEDPVRSAALEGLSAGLWHALMQYAVRDLPSAGWDMPAGLQTLSVCDPSGMLPTSACPNVVSEVFLEGRQPVQADTLYQVVQVNIETGLLATVFTPPELVEKRTYMAVPQSARAWAESSGILTPPTAYDTVREPSPLPDVHITLPAMFADARGVVQVQGTAAGAGFQSYRLEYGHGLYPSLWYQAGMDSLVPVSEGLLGQWDTTGLNGLYALRLMVVRDDQRVDQAVIQVSIDNSPPQVAAAYPQDGQVIDHSLEPQVALQAQASDPFLSLVEFYIDGSLVGQSTVSPFGVLWNARKGSHSLRILVTDRAGNTAEASIEFTVK